MYGRGWRGHGGERTHANMQAFAHKWTNIYIIYVCLNLYQVKFLSWKIHHIHFI